MSPMQKKYSQLRMQRNCVTDRLIAFIRRICRRVPLLLKINQSLAESWHSRPVLMAPEGRASAINTSHS